MSNIYLGLVHHPITNKRGEIVTTSVTNLDIHDISRSCKTFGVSKYFLITPIEAQQQLVGRILGHWNAPKAEVYNPDRSDALELAMVLSSFEDAFDWVVKNEGTEPLVVGTSAQSSNCAMMSEGEAISKAMIDKKPILLLFGTGWGIHTSLLAKINVMLHPILGAQGKDGYNHLSVRSAVAIYLDRLNSVRKPLR